MIRWAALFLLGASACSGGEAPSAREEIAAAAAPASDIELQPGEIAFRDGERLIRAIRVESGSKEAGLSPITLRYGGGRPEVSALVGRGAIVQIEPSDPGASDDAEVNELFASIGVAPIKPLMKSAGLWLVEDLGGGDGLDVASRLTVELTSNSAAPGRPRLRQAAPDLYLRHRALADPFVPDDPQFKGQWFFKNLNMSEAWSYSKGDPSTTVVVIDSGCDMKHPDLAAKMDPGKDVVAGDDDPTPDPGSADNAHGTACAGLIAASTNNGDGIAGGCPDCRLRCVLLLGDMATPISADVEAFTFALDTGAAVVSNSWGFSDPIPVPKALETAVNKVFDSGRGGKGALVVFAAGNDSRVVDDGELLGVHGVLGVGAINNNDEETPFTNSGNSVDLVAPTGTLTTDISGSEGYDPGDYTSLFGGTSSACPVVASIGALLISAAPEKTSAEIVDILVKTARPAPYAVPDANGHDPIFGYGIVDPVKALRSALNIQDSPDAGPPADGGSTPPPPADGADDGCGCSMPGRSSLPGIGPIGALGALAFYMARRAARRPRRRRASE